MKPRSVAKRLVGSVLVMSRFRLTQSRKKPLWPKVMRTVSFLAGEPRCPMVLCPKNVWEPKVSPQYEEQSLRALQENLEARVQWLHGGVADEGVEAEEQVLVPVVQRDGELREIVQEVRQMSGSFMRLMLVTNGVSRTRCRGNLCVLIQE